MSGNIPAASSCFSGWTIFLVLILLSALMQATIGANKAVGTLLLVGAIMFYMFQNSITGCRYPDPNA